AEATAIARSTQRAVATAFASTTAAPARNGASARVIAEAPISQTTVIAQAGGTDTDRVRTQVARLGIAGPLSALAGAGRDPDGTNLLGLDLATVASIAPTDALTGSGDTLLQLSLLFDSSGVGSGPITYTSDVQFDLLFSPGQSRSIAYTLGEIDAFGAGIQSFVLEIRIENGLGQTIRSNSQQDLEMLFDGQELALGRFSNDPLNPLDIDFHFAVTLGTPGDGIITGASLLAPVPLPAPLAMMVMALLVAAPALGRRGSTSTCQPSTAPKRRRPAP
ncbi:MAG: hypothetical protein KDK91_13110, partial [Gammaproteobacteria bacterium]|nr:hypothetical protein [Gammaproteobacteria bacterium]